MNRRIYIKFCCFLKMLNIAFDESAMSEAGVYKWYKRFQRSREDVEDDERLGCPSTSTSDENVEKVK